jgi:hypothetical protein
VSAVPNRVALRRTGLIWVHIVCAAVAGFALISQESLTFHFVTGRAGMPGIVLPAVWPYLVSFLIARDVAPSRGVYLALYTAVVIFVTIGGVWLVLYQLANSLSLGTVFLISIVQAVICAIAAGLIREHASAAQAHR